MKKIALFLSIIFMITACTANVSPKTNYGEPFFAAYQTKTHVGGLDIMFDKIEDSRCPTSATCIWKGIARIFLTIKENSISQNISIDYSEGETAIKAIEINKNKFSIEVNAVTPYPATPNNINPKDYKVKMQIKKL